MIKPEYKNIPYDEFVPLTENEVGKDLAGLYEINKKGEVRNSKNKKILKNNNSTSYPRLSLYCKNIHCKTFKVHILLAKKFIFNDDPNKKIYVDHIDRNINNYSLENLRWVTASENNINRDNGLKRKNCFYIKRKEKDGPIIDKVPFSFIEPNVRKYISNSIYKGYKYKGYYWEIVNIDVENRLKELGITEKDLKFVKNKKYPGIEVSKEGILKTKYGLTLGTLNDNYYCCTSGGKIKKVHRVIYETFSGIQLTSNDIIDHVNTNSLDNRFINLKLGTQKDNMNNPITLSKLSKGVNQIDISTGKIIKYFSGIIKACESLGKSDYSSISKCCNGKRKTAYGYKWEYADKQPDKDNNNKNN